MKRLSVVLLVLLLLLSLGFAQVRPPEGYWRGTLNVPGMALELGFKVNKQPDGSFRATLDVPEQSAMNIPVSRVQLTETQATFEVGAIFARFEGTFSADGRTLTGKFTQGGQAFDLILRWQASPPEPPRRPQTPVAPFPYRVEEVTVPNPKTNVTLAGTLTIPAGEGPFPAVILVSGSGPQDRDETLMEHKPFWVIADFFSRRGIAVLRYDDRGVGKSTGTFATATSMDFANDAEAAAEFLRSRPEVQKDAVGIVGHSEGGLIAPIVAARNPNLGFIVLMAGPGVPGDEILALQSRLITAASGAGETPAGLRWIGEAMLSRALRLVREVEDVAELRRRLTLHFEVSLAKLPEEARRNQPSAAALAAQLGSPWMRTFITFDPRPTLQKVRVPVLALNGTTDLQVWHDQNLPAIEQALRAGGNTRVTIVRLKGLNHLFQACPTGTPARYREIEETVNPRALQIMSDWILQTAQNKP